MALTQVPPALLTATTGTGTTVALSASPTFTGTVTTPSVTFSDASTQTAAASPYVLKNRIINGAMVIDQRNAGASVTPANGAYTIDRWYVAQTAGASKFSVQQNAASVTPPATFTNYLGATSLSAYTIAATDQYALRQLIEGYNVADLAYGTASAKTTTLSFWVYSSLTGTFGGALYNQANNKSYVFSYTISAANTWQQISITVPGDTATALASTNSAALLINLSIGYGTTYSTSFTGTWVSGFYGSVTGATSVVGTNGATFYITGVQLEVGSTATPFERRLYNQELANCQRYYFNDFTYCQGSFYSTTGIVGTNRLPVTMRASPSVSLTSGTTIATDIVGGSSSTMTPSFSYITPNSLRYSGTNGSSASIGSPVNITSSTIQASAEL
jgi:hypothetical protein